MLSKLIRERFVFSSFSGVLQVKTESKPPDANVPQNSCFMKN